MLAPGRAFRSYPYPLPTLKLAYQRARAVRWVILVAGLMVVSGCAGDPPDQTEPAASAEAWSRANDRSDCDEVNVLLPVDASRAQAALPPGFVVAPAETLFGDPGAPASSGKALLVLVAYACADSALEGGPVREAKAAVFIQPITLPTGVQAQADVNAYELSLWTDATATETLLRSVGFAVEPATTTVDLPAIPGDTARVVVTDAAGPVFEYETRAPAGRPPVTSLNRLWHQATGGLTLFETKRVDHVERGGPILACTMREGSVASVVAGTTDCATGAIAVVYPAWTAESTVRHWPGLVVQPE